MKKERSGYSGLSIMTLAMVMAMLSLPGCRQNSGPVLIGKVLSAYGGEQALRRIRSVVYQGEIAATMRRDRGREVIYFQRPGRLRVSLAYSRSREERVLNGIRGWRNSGEGFREVEGPPLEAMVFQYRHLDLPLGLVDGGYRISFSEEKRNGRSFPVLNLKSPEGPPMIVTVDPDTGLILHVAGIFNVEGGTARLEVDYGDYRAVSGVMLPHLIVNYAGGMEIARTVFDQVEVNEPLDPRIFSPVDIPAKKD